MNITTSYERNSVAFPNAPGLPDPYKTQLEEVFSVWSKKLKRNILKLRYYDQKNALKDMGISIPPPLANDSDFLAVVEWPSKAVDALATRSRFDGFVGEGAATANTLFSMSHIATKYPMMTTSELTQSCAFASVTRSYSSPARIIFYSALNAAATWDYENDRVKTGLTVTNVDKRNRPTGYNLFTDTAIVTLRRHPEKNEWTFEIFPHPMGRPPFVSFAYNASLDRPFGKSRIDRAIMSITDEAVREAVRMSVASEFAVAPQRYILGAPDEFLDEIPQWQAYIGNILAITRDADNQIPTVGQFSQGDIQQHVTLMRSLAARMAGASSVPISSLGVIHDNPSSAEAMFTAERELTIKATHLNTSNGDALKDLAVMSIAVANNTSYAMVEDVDITPKFLSPAYPDVLSQGDAVLKFVNAFPWASESRVTLEMMGLDEAQITRLMSDKRKKEASDAILALNNAMNVTNAETEPVNAAKVEEEDVS